MAENDFVISPYETLTIKTLFWEGNDAYVLWPGILNRLLIFYSIKIGWIITQFVKSATTAANLKSMVNISLIYYLTSLFRSTLIKIKLNPKLRIPANAINQDEESTTVLAFCYSENLLE